MLFANTQVMGTFKGFNDRGMEFAAEIVAPYDVSMLERPQLGQFILIELASQEEASLGRITRFVPSGLLSSTEGEDYVNTMQQRGLTVPEDLKRQRLKYRVQVKLLGAIRVVGEGEIVYVPSQRRLPHLGAKVAMPSPAVLQKLCSLSQGETDLGDYVLGEFVYCGSKVEQGSAELQSIDPKLTVKFNINNLVSRRSVVFARAGYGKSNLIKFLVAELYKEQPKTDSGKDVGTLIFDADGEYFWPDNVKGRPGLCDVPQLQDKLVVFTNRQAPSPYYGSWKVGDVKLDLRELKARDVIGVAITPERQTNQNVLKLKSVSDSNWQKLVDVMDEQGLAASDKDIGELLGYSGEQIKNSMAEIAAARSNMFSVVRLLHDPNSRLLAGTREALLQGSVVVMDISLLSAMAGEMVAGLLMRQIFSYNQENFTGGAPIIPTIVIIEEAQSVLGRHLDETSPFVEWVKEGRKYDLGAVLITQQPGSMAPEIMSQSDNWFCFHLLSQGDAETLGRYNSHFSNDVLAHLIAEPIRGNCYMWSAPHQPFVLPVRVRNFEEIYQGNVNKNPQEPEYDGGTRAKELNERLSSAFERLNESFVEALKSTRVKFYRIPKALPGDVDGIGIKTGQLYFVIRDIKTSIDTQSENQLMRPLLTHLLGEGSVLPVSHEKQDYFCSTLEKWSLVLGKPPRLVDLK